MGGSFGSASRGGFRSNSSSSIATAFSSCGSSPFATRSGRVEGVEINFLGLVAGLDLRHPALKLPGYGRLGMNAILPVRAE